MDVIKKIKELGREEHEELREYCNLKFEEILKFLPRRLISSDGADLLGCILKGISEIPLASMKRKVKIIDIALQTMRKESTSLTHCADIIGVVCLELPRLPASDLVRLCNDSVQSIVDDSDVNMIWGDILPECMRSLLIFDTVKHCDTEMTSIEYKEQCVHTLCQCRWREKQLVQLAAMFKDMQLSKTSHKQVVNKICSYILDIPPDILPPLVHQLLKLCKQNHLEIVLSHLSHYFTTRLYSKLEPPPQDSESTTMDIDDIVPHSPAELSRCLSTCIYHISQGVVEPQLVRKHIKTWPKTQLLRAPFIIDLALAISDKGADFRSVCLDAIRSAIEQRVMDEIKQKESAWVRAAIPPDVDVASVLKVLTTESANHRQLTVVGLINLSFSLLGVPRSKPAARACWSHATLILVRLCKSQPETAGHILAQLADKLALDSGVQKQYADCLYVLCKLSTLSVERCPQLGSILENCRPAASEHTTAAAVLRAVHPLLNYSVRTRDVLVMVCRKGLYSRDSLQRCLAVSGFLTVLRHIRLSRSCPTSQSGSDHFSACSYLTQLSVDMHNTLQGNAVASRFRNEAVGMEVVSILRRCLVQDAAVKQLLYTNIFDCVKEKPVLHESVYEILYEHLFKYLPEDEGSMPLVLDKCIQLSGTTAELTEPIGVLLYAVAQFTQAADVVDDDDILSSQSVASGAAYLKNKLNLIMEKLCKSEFHIDLEDPGITDLTPESKAKCIKVQQILQCYESLIAYKIMQWDRNSTDVATSVYKLFKACNQLIEQTKAPPKLGKKASSKSLNETKETVKSQKSQKEKGKAPMKMTNLVKERAGPFKPLPCVWDMKFCVRIIELLYSEEVQWCSRDERNLLIGRCEFHHWCMRCVQCALSAPLDKRCVAAHVLAVAAVLYRRCVARFEAIREFDEQTALGCLELFKTCLTLLFSQNYALKMNSFLPVVTDLTDATPSICIAAILENIHTALLKTESADEEEARDQMDKKIHSTLVATAAVLIEVHTKSCVELNNVIVKLEEYVRCNNYLLYESAKCFLTACSILMTEQAKDSKIESCALARESKEHEVIVKLEEYVRCSKQDITGLVAALLSAGSAAQQDSPLLDELLDKLTAALGRIDEDDTSAGEESSHFPYIDSATGHAVLNLICVHLNSRFKCTEHLLQRAKDLTLAGNMAAGPHEQRIDKEVKSLYKSLVVQACQLAAWTARCGKLRCSVGAGSDRVLATCVKLYSLLATFAKQIDVATAQIVRFERLLKLSGKKLSTVIDGLITYLGEAQQQNASKVLRDTKLIPRLVLEGENYTKHVILLADKAKLNWQHYLSLGTARDFRIKGPVIQEMLNARDQINEQTRDEDGQENINDAVTEILSPLANEDEGNDHSDEETNITRKRRKVS